MTHAEYIVEKLLDDEKESGTGIFMKQLDSGRRVYSCKCPTCGTIHGGYRTYGEAEKNLKCREHHRKEIDKTKKELEKVDKPKKQKDLFKNPNKKEMSFGEAEEDFGDEESEGDWKDVTDMNPDRAMYTLYDGTEFYPVSRDGFITRQGHTDFSYNWKVKGMTFHHRSGVITPWQELRMRLSRGEKLNGYFWDIDHGTLRKWGRKVSLSLDSNVGESLQDALALLAGVT